MNFTKTLLAGAAICALAGASTMAYAAPNIHLAGGQMANGLHVGHMTAHQKSNVAGHAPGFTTTAYISGSIPDSLKGTPVLLYAFLWRSGCNEIKPEKQSYKTASTTVHKITKGTTTGNISGCGSAVYTFYGPVYKLKTKKANSDSFTGKLKATTTTGYKVTLNEVVSLTITH